MNKKIVLIAFEEFPEGALGRQHEVTRSNPQYWKFDGVRAKFTHIYAPSFPHIEAAYEKEGKTIFRSNAEEQTSNDSVQTPDTNSSNTDDISVHMESPSDNDVQEEAPVSYEDFEVGDTKPDYHKMKWLELRTFAKRYTDEVIKNKEHALEILEELDKQGRL